MYVANAKRLTLAGARKMMSTAMGIAEKENIPIAVAIADAGGHLIAMERSDGGRFHTVHSSTTKAVCAASNKRPTTAKGAAAEKAPAAAHGAPAEKGGAAEPAHCRNFQFARPDRLPERRIAQLLGAVERRRRVIHLQLNDGLQFQGGKLLDGK